MIRERVDSGLFFLVSTDRSEMDLFLYNSTYRVWICTAPHQFAVPPPPGTLLSHLRTRHQYHIVNTPALSNAAQTDAECHGVGIVDTNELNCYRNYCSHFQDY